MMPVLLTVHSTAQDSIVPGKLTVGDSLLDNDIALDVAGGFKVVKKNGGSVVQAFSMEGTLTVPFIEQYTGSFASTLAPYGLAFTDSTGMYQMTGQGETLQFYASDFNFTEAKYQFHDENFAPLMLLRGSSSGGSTLTLNDDGLERIKLDATLGKITIAGSDVLTEANIATGTNNFPLVSNLAIRGGDPVTGNYFFSADSTQTKIGSNTLSLGAVGGNTTLAGTPVYQIIAQDGGTSTITHRSNRWGHVTYWDTSTLGQGYQKYAELGSWSQFNHGTGGGYLGSNLVLKSPEPGALPFFESRRLEVSSGGPTATATSILQQNGVGAYSTSNGRSAKNPMFHAKSTLNAGAVDSELAFYDTRTANKMLSVRSSTPASGGVTGSSTLTTSTFEVRHPLNGSSAPALLSVTGQAGGGSSAQVNTDSFSFASGGNSYGHRAVAMSGSYVEGSYSIGVSGSYVEGQYGTAMSGAFVQGNMSTAMSEGSAYGHGSVAGSGSLASGVYTTAFSGGQTSGNMSMAVVGGIAQGDLSFSAGANAQSYNSAAFGRFNKLSGSTTTWVETDPLLVVGNGSSGSAENQSNAVEVLKNGRTTITNKAWKNRDASKTALEDPTEAETDSAGEALIIEGHTVLKGKVIIAEPQGDIPMFGE